MRRLALLVALLAPGACGGGSTPKAVTPEEISYHTALAGEEPPPVYTEAELRYAITHEQTAVARLERDVAAAEVGGTPSPRDDLRVRQRFLQTLEVCKAYGRMCPPRLDEPAWQYDIESDADPTLDAPLRFDVESWRKVADELHGRACACRSLACVDSMEVALARLETRPMPDVRQDDVASLSVTSARDCLNRLRGGRAVPHP